MKNRRRFRLLTALVLICGMAVTLAPAAFAEGGAFGAVPAVNWISSGADGGSKLRNTGTGETATLSFDPNGGEAIEPMEVTVGESCEFPLSMLAGYSQEGWYVLDGQGNMGDLFAKGGESRTIERKEDLTLIMKREIEPPTVTVKLSAESQDIEGDYPYYYPAGPARVLTAETEEHSGLDYAYAWSKDGNPIQGAEGKTLRLDGTVADTGRYTVRVTVSQTADSPVRVDAASAEGTGEISVEIRKADNTVCFDPNGGTGGPEKAVTGGLDAPIPTEQPSREGYDFSGWNTAEDGGGDRYEGGGTYAFTDTTGGNGGMAVTLYAQWEAREYTLRFDAAGGNTPEPVKIRYDAALGALPEPRRENYVFEGWFYPDGTQARAGELFRFAEDTVLTARWKEESYTLSFNAGQGTAEPGSVTVFYGKPIGELAAATRKGYTFGGWFYADGTQAKSSDICSTRGDLELSARWTANTYTIRFDPNGGKTDVKEKKVSFGQELGELPVPTREGCKFAGWCDNDGRLYLSSTVYDVAGDVSVYACWIDPGAKPKTGDGAEPWLYAALMLGSLGAGAYTAAQLKKRRDNE